MRGTFERFGWMTDLEVAVGSVASSTGQKRWGGRRAGGILGLVALGACTGPDKLAGDGALLESPGPTETGHTGDTAPIVVTLTQIAEDDPATVTTHTIERVSGVAEVSEDGETLSGSIAYGFERDGRTDCDLEVGLSGTAVSGLCEGCDFVFKIDAEVVDDQGSTRCDALNAWTMLGNGFYVNQHLAFAEEYPLYTWGGYDLALYTNVLQVGVGYDWDYYGGPYGYRPGPYFTVMIWEGPYTAQGEASFTGNTLSWSFDREEDTLALNHYAFCNTAHQSYADSFYGGTMVSGAVDCGVQYMDGWAVDVEAGQVVSVSVDAPSVDDFMIPYLIVNGPDGCGVVRATENFVCTSLTSIGSEYLGCPSATFTADQSGTYEMWIASRGLFCSAGPALYDLYVDIQ